MNFIRFLSLLEDYDMIEKFAKRENTLYKITIEDLTFLPYQTLKHIIPDLIKQKRFEEVIFTILDATKIRKITLKNVKRLDNYKKLMFFFYIQDQYKVIYDLEVKYLSQPPDAKMQNAGIRNLDVLGDIVMIDDLAEGDILKWNQIRELPYSMIFEKRLKTNIQFEINRKLSQQKH